MAIKDINRYQLILENQLEDWVSQDNPVRFISALVLKFYKERPSFFDNNKGNKKTGRKSYHPASMLMLFLYGYLYRINSSRRLEQETYRNMEVIWLLGNEQPDHKTISDFRKDNSKLISSIAKEFRLFLKSEGFIDGSLQAFDGTKIKAYTNKDFVNSKELQKRIQEMEKNLQSYLTLLEQNDRKDDLSEEDNQELLALEEQVAQLKIQLQEQATLLAMMQEQGLKDYYANDSQAKRMKTLDGFLPAYNVQVGVDAKNKMITSGFVTTEEGDQHLLQANVEASKEQIGIYPDTALADKGYATSEEIEAVEKNEVTTCVVAMPETLNMKKESEGVYFEYNEQEDFFTCAKGEKLNFQSERNCKGIQKRFYRISKNPCKSCSLFGVCTKNKHEGRRLEMKTNFKDLIKYRNRSKAEDYKTLVNQRKAIIEHVFGTIKMWMGKVPLLLTSQKKVQIEIDLYTTCYNLRRLFNIIAMPVLLRKLENYTLKTI